MDANQATRLWGGAGQRTLGRGESPKPRCSRTRRRRPPLIQTLLGHSDRHQALEAKARNFAMFLERNNLPDSFECHFPQRSLSVAAGRSEVESRAVIVVTDRTSYESPMPDHRPSYPPPPAPPTPSEFSVVTGPEPMPRTPPEVDVVMETPALVTPPGASGSTTAAAVYLKDPKRDPTSESYTL